LYRPGASDHCHRFALRSCSSRARQTRDGRCRALSAGSRGSIGNIILPARVFMGGDVALTGLRSSLGNDRTFPKLGAMDLNRLDRHKCGLGMGYADYVARAIRCFVASHIAGKALRRE
jgi:hypothetical protein